MVQILREIQILDRDAGDPSFPAGYVENAGHFDVEAIERLPAACQRLLPWPPRVGDPAPEFTVDDVMNLYEEFKSCRVEWDRQMQGPVPVVRANAPVWTRPFRWMFRGRIYETQEDLDARDVAALALEAENKRRVAIAKAHALAEIARQIEGKPPLRHPIPDDVKVYVWRRDGGRCATCGSKTDLEFDHVIPVTMGGSSSARNVQLLCERCNRSKGGAVAPGR